MTGAISFLTAAALLGYGWLTLFQVLLSLGAPLGQLAWGGGQRVLPAALRLASALSAGLAAFGAICVAQARSLIDWLPTPVLRPALFALAGLFALSLIGNALSRSRAEQVHGIVLTTLLSSGSLAGALLVARF